MIRVSFDFHDGGWINRLNKMEARSHDFTAVFEKARVRLAKANDENFSTGGMPVGGWAPRTQPAGWPLMIKTGALAGSLSSLTGPPNRITPTSATFGTDVEYAHFHQTGTRKMAARKIIYEPVGFAKETAKDMAQHIVGPDLRF